MRGALSFTWFSCYLFPMKIISTERLNVLAEKLPKSAEESPVSTYNELYGAMEATELIRLARLGLEHERKQNSPADPIKWLESYIDVDLMGNQDVVYSLPKIKAKFEVRELGHGGYLVLWSREHWLDFAVMEWFTEENDNIIVKAVFHGGGTLDPLREFRHTYWGEDGYIFYANGSLIVSALNALNEYFDVMGRK